MTNLFDAISDISVEMQDRAAQGCYTTRCSKKSLEGILDESILSGFRFPDSVRLWGFFGNRFIKFFLQHGPGSKNVASL